MVSFIKNIMALSGVLGIFFGAYIYITEKPAQGLKETRAELEKKIDDTEASLRADMKEKREQRDKEIADFKVEIRRGFDSLSTKLDKVEDHLFEMQRAQKSRGAAALGGSHDFMGTN